MQTITNCVVILQQKTLYTVKSILGSLYINVLCSSSGEIDITQQVRFPHISSSVNLMTLTYSWKIGWTESITLFRHDKNKPFLSIDCPPCFYIPTQETSCALFRIKDICESFVCFKYHFIETSWKETMYGEFFYKAQSIFVS